MERKHYMIYYVNKIFLDAETIYTLLEQLALSQIEIVKKLKHYFQSHTIIVLTSHLSIEILHSLDASKRLMKWVIALRQCDIKYDLRTTKKAQILNFFPLNAQSLMVFIDSQLVVNQMNGEFKAS